MDIGTEATSANWSHARHRAQQLDLREGLRRSSRSVDAIAAGMGKRLGVKVTPDILYSFTADSHPHRFPLEWAVAWIKETGDWSLFHVLTDGLGLPRPTQQDADLLAYGRHALQKDLTESEMEVLKARILQGGKG